MSFATIRQAISDAVDGLPVGDGTLRCSPYVRDTINPPQAFVLRGETTYDTDFDHVATRTFQVQVYLQRDAEDIGQRNLDALCEPDSGGIPYAILNDSGVAAALQVRTVTSARDAQVVAVGDVQYLFTELEITGMA